MPWLRAITVLFVFLAAFGRPASASAFVVGAPASSEARVSAFELVAIASVGASAETSPGLHEGIGRAYDENASGYRFASGGADDAVTGFRAVSRAEADDIARHGFRPDPSGRGFQEGKWFSESREGAETFRRTFSDLDDVVETRVPRAVYERSLRHPNIDGTGPGFCVQCSDLPLLPKP